MVFQLTFLSSEIIIFSQKILSEDSMKKLFLAVLIIFLTMNGLFPSEISVPRVKERIEKIGGIKFKTSFEIDFMSRNKFSAYIGKYFDKTYPADVSKKEGKFLNIMGFLKRGQSLNEIRKRVIKNNAGGLYDENSGKLIIINEFMNSDPVFKLVLVHELRHALQDQHYNISRMFGSLSDFDDRKLAKLAVLEGDAMFVMSRYAKEYTPFPVSPELSTSGYSSDSLLSFSPVKFSHNLDNVPSIIKNNLTMPYVQGLKFMLAVYRRGKWKGINKVLSNPPVSTEQILHPKKYFKGEIPVSVSIVYKPDGYSIFHSGTIGEFMLNILLAGNKELVDKASGWGGDTFNIYINGNSYVLLWKSVWDKKEYCSRFFTDFRNFTEELFSVSYRKGNVKGNPFLAGKSKSGYLFIRKVGKTVFYMKTNNRKEINTFINGGYYD